MGCVCSCSWLFACCKGLEKKICCCKKVHCCTCPHKNCKKKRCCHCRPKKEIPYEITRDTIDTVCSSKEYNSWIKGSQAQQARTWFYQLTFLVDLYCWLLIIGNFLGIFFAHLIPIMAWFDPETYKPWGTCLYFETNDLPSSKVGKYSIGCVLEFHAFNIPVMGGVIAFCIYTLIKWNYNDIPRFLRIIQLTNILEFGFMIYEGLICWIVFVRGDPWFQTWTIFALALLITIGVILGIYIQFVVQEFFEMAVQHEIEFPKTEYEIISLVRETYIDRGKIRCVGSKHSAPNSIYVDNVFGENQIMISLDHYTGIEIIKVDADDNISVVRDDEKIDFCADVKYRAVVKGGTCLGLNRENALSHKSNGLVYILQKKGFALQDCGGVVMQTVGGFTATGCAGGTIYHDYYESVHSIRMINGTGDVVVFTKPAFEDDKNYQDPYWGAIVSMGLMGIISQVTFDLIPNYNVLGSQLVWPVSQKKPKYKISWLDKQSVTDEQKIGCGDGTGTLDIYAENSAPNSLFNLFKAPENKYKTEYCRVFVWPQTNPNLVTVWKGHREQKDDGPPNTIEWKANYKKKDKFVPVYYYEVDKGEKGIFEQKMLSLLYNYFDHYANENTFKYPPWMVKVVKFLIKMVNSCPGTQYFGASWAEILPMDQEMWTKLMPMQFTELWFDINDTDRVMNVLKTFWAEKNNERLEHSGTFSWEFYPARAGGYAKKDYPGGAWLRPAYGMEAFRVDVLWFDIKTDTPYEFFTQLWDTFASEDIPLIFRPHWAKWFPGGNVAFPTESKLYGKFKKWNDYYADLYPKWKDWHELRNKMDPQNIFLSTYWADALNIKCDNVEVINGDNCKEFKGDGLELQVNTQIVLGDGDGFRTE